MAAGTQCHSCLRCAGDDVIVLAEDDDTYEPAQEPPPTGASPLAHSGLKRAHYAQMADSCLLLRLIWGASYTLVLAIPACSISCPQHH